MKPISPAQLTEVRKLQQGLFTPHETQLLMRRVHRAARDEQELRLFTSIVRHAYEDVRELEVLYDLAPDAITGKPNALRQFKAMLLRSSGMKKAKRPAAVKHSPVRRKPAAACWEEPWLVKPEAITELALAADWVAGKDRDFYWRAAATIKELWCKGERLNRLFRHAASGVLANGEDLLADELRSISRRSAPKQSLKIRIPGTGTGGGGVGDPSDECWPPDNSGPPLVWPPEDDLRGGWEVILAPIDDSLVQLDGLSADRGPVATADGITGLEPSHICSSAGVTILGHFAERQPSSVVVLVGSTRVEVLSWTSTSIRIHVPAGISSGCVGFLDTESETFYHPAPTSGLGGTAYDGESADLLSIVFRQRGRVITALRETERTPPDTGVNRLLIGRPQIRSFTANGQSPLAIVDPSDPVVLAWEVVNAPQQLELTRVWGNDGDVSGFSGTGNTWNLGPFGGNSTRTSLYRLTARNGCGGGTAEIEIRSARAPALRIIGVELVQTIQHFDQNAQSGNNSVPLVARKRTLARVYLESGRSDGFDNNHVWVNGSIELIRTDLPFRTEVAPLLPANTPFTALPLSSINRNNLSTTLNFELPWQSLEGEIVLNVNVWATGFENVRQPGWRAHYQTPSIQFVPSRRLEIRPILVTDCSVPGIVTAPSRGNFDKSLEQLLVRLPLGEDDLTVRDEVHENCFFNLGLGPGWIGLLAALRAKYQGEGDGNTVFAALVPYNQGYSMGGLALDKIPNQSGIFVAQAEETHMAHEFCHVFHRNHPDIPFSGLPTQTEEVGFDFSGMYLVSAGADELMNPDGSVRWASIALWNQMIQALQE